MIKLKNTYRITLDGMGGCTTDDIFRDAAQIKELVGDAVDVVAIHNERAYIVKGTNPIYVATPVDIPSGNYAVAQMATNRFQDLHK